MGIQASTGGVKGRLFLSINGKDGTLTSSVKDEGSGRWAQHKFDAGTTVEGTLVDIHTKEDSVNGQAITKGILLLRDTEPGQPDMQIEFGLWRQTANQPDPSVGETPLLGRGVRPPLTPPSLNNPLFLPPCFRPGGGPWAMNQGRRTSGLF